MRVALLPKQCAVFLKRIYSIETIDLFCCLEAFERRELILVLLQTLSVSRGVLRIFG